ncbi:MAG: hypothetical protein KDA86_01670 [Planctomycetaceae bacterium]|nr:hypothetical protein [Planctomycetaceae bacterium]
MRRCKVTFSLVLCLCAVTVIGCGDAGVNDASPDLPDWLSEDETPSEFDTSVESTPVAPALDRAALQLSLQPGDRFPMRKLVEQELKQASLNGVPQISRSRLELLLAIAVEDVQPDHTQMKVIYDRVRYSHEVAGELVEYDSTSPPNNIPTAVMAYHGMVGDGFSFVLGRDNQIASVIGFREFLERCLQHVPSEQRQRVMLDIEAGTGEKGIADFVDNSIGLLPADVEKVLGDTWKMDRHIGKPVPMQIQTIYTLKELSDGFAVVSIAGEITPSTSLGQSANTSENVRITVKGGHSHGQCTIFLDSGLPKESRVERTVDMTVQMAGGLEFEQQKNTVTTVETFPSQSSRSMSTAIQPASHETTGPRFQ